MRMCVHIHKMRYILHIKSDVHLSSYGCGAHFLNTDFLRPCCCHSFMLQSICRCVCKYIPAAQIVQTHTHFLHIKNGQMHSRQGLLAVRRECV